MSPEQGPKPLKNLRNRLNMVNQVSSKIDSMIQNPGGEFWPKHLRTDNLSDPEERWEKIARVGEIAEKYKNVSLPIIEEKKDGF